MAMKINLAKSAGFCFGVKRALNIAFNTASSGTRVYMLGDIVHNEDVVREIQKTGIKKIGKLSSGKGKTLLIRAHGTESETIKRARRLGYKIIDATCPMVKEIHKIAQSIEQKGHKVIIIGDKEHDEVRGIIGHLKREAIVIDKPKNIPLSAIKKIRRAGVVVQSTQNIEDVLGIVDILSKYIKELKFFNTICQPTRIKQQDIKIMPKVNDAMIIIGSKTSANTRRLYEISKKINKKSYWVKSRKEIKPEWFKGVSCVGVTAGASTPESTIKEVIEYLKKLDYRHK